MVKEKRTKKELETTTLACCIARDLDVQRVVVWPTKTFGCCTRAFGSLQDNVRAHRRRMAGGL